MSEIKKPELLAPAGDLEKLKTAILYGADAVYIGGQTLGLRSKAKNFDLDTMKEGIAFAHKHKKKVYVTANIFAHNSDFIGMEEYFKDLHELGVDALIISDLGVFSVARKAVPNMEIHISTQANNTNYHSALLWKQLGASRIVLARELSFNEIGEIKSKIPYDFQIEAFVHGAMCISYSGRCLLSNYMSSRDANRGECSQPCRWKYHLVEEKRPGEYMPVFEDDRGTYIYNSKDLCMIDYIEELLKAGVNSFKIEGRMKTPYYVATIVKTYREAVDDYFISPEIYKSKKEYYLEQLKKSSHRFFTTGFYNGKPTCEEQVYGNSSYIRIWDFIGVVLHYDEATGYATIEQRNKFATGDCVEFFITKGEGFFQVIEEMYDEKGNLITEAPHPKQIIKLKVNKKVQAFDFIRKEIQ